MANQAELQDPEMSYRRGYHNAAHEVLRAVAHLIPKREHDIVEEWILGDLAKWRAAAMEGKSARDAKGSVADVLPPLAKLHSIKRKAAQ